MELDKLKIAKELEIKINGTKRRISDIIYLLNDNKNIEGVISAKNNFKNLRSTIVHYFNDAELLRNILNKDLFILKVELDILEKEFNDL